MSGDFSRFRFNPRDHYDGVLMQQGRVQLDQDWNAQLSIARYQAQTRSGDIIGVSGVPAAAPGFGVTLAPKRQEKVTDLLLSAGRFYAQGVLCELEQGSPVAIEVNPTDRKRVTVLSWVVDGVEFRQGQWVNVDETTLQILSVEESERELTLNEAVTGSPSWLQRLVTYRFQPQLPPGAMRDKPGTYLVYLDNWSREVGELEEPGIREVALNGADTAVRAQSAWQVGLMNIGPIDLTEAQKKKAVEKAVDGLNARWAARGKLCGRRVSPSTTALQNQLYRVQIFYGAETKPTLEPCERTGKHEITVKNTAGWQVGQTIELAENNAPPRITQILRVNNEGGGKYRIVVAADVSDLPDEFQVRRATSVVWASNNASVAAPVEPIEADRITLRALGSRFEHAFQDARWVEITNRFRVYQGQPGIMVEVKKVTGNTLTIAPWPEGGRPALGPDPIVRLWDSSYQSPLATPWMVLVDGIEVQFEPGRFETADYWLIVARTATADIEWPQDQKGPMFRPPEGVHHTYSALATVVNKAVKGWTSSSDLRTTFSDMTRGYVSQEGGKMRGPLEIDAADSLTTTGWVEVAKDYRAPPAPEPNETLKDNLKVRGGLLVDAGKSNDGISLTQVFADSTWHPEIQLYSIGKQPSITYFSSDAKIADARIQFVPGSQAGEGSLCFENTKGVDSFKVEIKGSLTVEGTCGDCGTIPMGLVDSVSTPSPRASDALATVRNLQTHCSAEGSVTLACADLSALADANVLETASDGSTSIRQSWLLMNLIDAVKALSAEVEALRGRLDAHEVDGN